MQKVLFFMGFWVVMLIAATFLSSCGRSVSLSEDDEDTYSDRRTPKDPDVMTVEFYSSKCSTGRHVFRHKSDYCNGLRDNRLMNYCARADRMRVYHLRCDSYK